MAVGTRLRRTATLVLATGLMTGLAVQPAQARTVHVDVDVDATLTCYADGGAEGTYTLTNQGTDTIHLDEVEFTLFAPSTDGLTRIFIWITPIWDNQNVAPGASMTLSGIPVGDELTNLSGQKLELITHAVNTENSSDGAEWHAQAVFTFDGCS